VRGFGQAVMTLSSLPQNYLHFFIDVLNFIRILCFKDFSPPLLTFLKKEEKRLKIIAADILPLPDQLLNWHFLFNHLVDQIGEWGALSDVWLYPCERVNLWMRGLIHSRVHGEENVLNTIYALVSLVRGVPSNVKNINVLLYLILQLGSFGIL